MSGETGSAQGQSYQVFVSKAVMGVRVLGGVGVGSPLSEMGLAALWECWGSKVCVRGGGGCQAISTGILSEGENFATSRNVEACCYCLVGSGWKQTHLCPFPPPGTPLHMSEFTVLTCSRIHFERGNSS